MPETIYTLGVWRVKPESESEFITAWKAIGVIFSQLPAPPIGKGTLIQSLTEPSLFYSFGPWPSEEAVQAMRQDPQAQAGIERLRELCTEAIPGSFRLVAEA
jgi:hypothetical protein